MNKLRFEERIPIDKIDISVSNVRKTNPEERIDELKKSIKEIGIQQPIMVLEKPDGRFELIIGQRRYLACKALGLKEIPALITSVRTKTEAVIKSFSENIHRLDLEYRDKMQVAMELKNKLGSIDAVAKALGVSIDTARNYLGYSAVPEPIKRMVDQNRLGAGTAIRIARSIPDEEKATKIAEKIREVPRDEHRRRIIEVAKENPDKGAEEIIRFANKQKFRKLTIDLTPRIAEALDEACHKYNSEANSLTVAALEEWLKGKGFIR